MSKIIKSNAISEKFNEEKLRRGMLKALEKRPVSLDAVETEIYNIKSYIRATQVSEEYQQNMDALKNG